MSLTGGLAAAVDGLRDGVDAVGPILCFLQSVLVRILEDIPCRADQLRHTACEADQSEVQFVDTGEVTTGGKYSFCWACGQKLDWDVEEYKED